VQARASARGLVSDLAQGPASAREPELALVSALALEPVPEWEPEWASAKVPGWGLELVQAMAQESEPAS
jgi:hypothetical protein